MDIGIGLPNTLPVDGTLPVTWARRAEARGFARVATIDRIVYPTFDSLISLAAAAGATSRIGLFTDILLAPVYPPVWLAKATASLHAMSSGRLTLGLGVGGRPDDFAAMNRPMSRRGRLMDETLDLLDRAWAGESVTGDEFGVVPASSAGTAIPVLIGGNGDAAVRRTVRYGAGWTAGGGGPELIEPMAAKVREAWRNAGREGEPRIAAVAYVGLGDEKQSHDALSRYYGFAPQMRDAVVRSVVSTPDAARDLVRAFAGIGVSELVFAPSVGSLDEVDRLADAVL